jgi:hypothetical protein
MHENEFSYTTRLESAWKCPICGGLEYNTLYMCEAVEIEYDKWDEDFAPETLFFCKKCSIVFKNPNKFSKEE